jgi:hypothetical protein
MKKLRDYIPALKYGAKLLPQDIAGMLGLPYVGNIWYVDPYAGDDAADDGTTQDAAFKTVSAAFAKCTSGKHDVVVIAPTGGSGRSTETAVINWNKRFTHLIGSAGPIHSNPRAGMTFTVAGTPCFTVSENGCIFKNITFYASAAAELGCVLVTGDYNYFEGCQFNGMMHATAAADAGSYCLRLTTADENEFVGCTFGSISVARTAANANVVLGATNSMNRFRDCDFNVQATNAGVFWISAIASDCIGGFVDFLGCRFINFTTTAMTVGFTHGIIGGGFVRFLDSSWVGATNLSDNYLGLYTNVPAFDSSDAGLLTQAAD